MGYWDSRDLSVLNGLKLTEVTGLNNYNDVIHFYTECGRHFQMLHNQDCCESVSIEEIHGDVDDLRDATVIQAYEDSNDGQSQGGECEQWTFYVIMTNKGTVTIRWYGVSNGYYSTSVSFEEVK